MSYDPDRRIKLRAVAALEAKEREDGEVTIEELKKGASDSFAEIMEENARKKKEAAAERHKHNEKVKREYRLKGK